MISALAALVAIAQPATIPPLPLSASAEVRRVFVGVQRSLAQGDFATAEKELAGLPRRAIRLAWDLKGVPPEQKSGFVRGRDRALEAWNRTEIGLKVEFVTEKPDILVSFVPTLPPDPDFGGVPAAVFLTAFTSNEPKVDAVIALKRGAPGSATDSGHVANEIAFAIGKSLGLERNPKPGGSMGRVDSSFSFPVEVFPLESRDAERVLLAVDALRAFAQAKKKAPEPEFPLATIDVKRLDGGEVLQHSPMTSSFLITNQGKAQLQVRILPDCSCFSLGYKDTIEPGASQIVRVAVDTVNFSGRLNKALYIYSNDPEMPLTRIEYKGYIRPLYRFFDTSKSGVIVVSKAGAEHELKLAIDPSRKISIQDVQLNGIPGQVEQMPWKETLADPANEEGPLPRQGYRFNIKMKPSLVTGRYPVTLSMTSDDPDAKTIIATFYVQVGIVAQPPAVFFGEVSQSENRAWTVLTRPGQTFKVTSVKTDRAWLTAKAEDFGNGDVRISVTTARDIPYGRIQGTVTVMTDDRDQPQILVPVTGIVK